MITLHARYGLDVFLSKNTSLSDLFDLENQAYIDGIIVGLFSVFQSVKGVHGTCRDSINLRMPIVAWLSISVPSLI
jgi:hypothetical protein